MPARVDGCPPGGERRPGDPGRFPHARCHLWGATPDEKACACQRTEVVGGQCLAGALAEVARAGDERAWLELLMLPKAALRTALRGGKKNRTKCESETKELCRAWLEGQRGALWTAARRGGRAARRGIAGIGCSMVVSVGVLFLRVLRCCAGRGH